MKKMITTLALVLTCTQSFADLNGRDRVGFPGGPMVPTRPDLPRDPRDNRDNRDPFPGPFPGRGGAEELRACLQEANRAKSELQICLSTRIDPRELDSLRSENLQLMSFNDQLRRENSSLKLEIDRLNRDRRDPRDPRDPRRSFGFFSYASCLDYRKVVDLRYISGAEGMFQLESETNAKQKVSTDFNCSYGIAAVKSEEIRSNGIVNYCVAGCLDYRGEIDQKYIQSGRGRNQTEAEYNALKATAQAYNCSYGVKISSCQ